MAASCKRPSPGTVKKWRTPAPAVQYTRDSSALVGALKKAYALHTQGIHPRRSPLDRVHIYFIDYRRPGWRRLQTHPTLRERIKTWGGDNISGAELRAILSNIAACRNNRAAAPLQPIAPLPEPNPSYPPATYDRLLAAKLQPAPDDPAARPACLLCLPQRRGLYRTRKSRPPA